MNAKVVLKVGPVKASFAGKVTLSNLDPPNGYTISGEGSGGAAGFAKGSAIVKLADDGPGATNLTYEVKAQIGGKLAQLGSRLIDATSKKLAGEFFEKFSEAVSPPPAPAAGDEAATPEKKKGWFRSLIKK
jgi:carbon monoxide dehydrogenase subunit G